MRRNSNMTSCLRLYHKVYKTLLEYPLPLMHISLIINPEFFRPSLLRKLILTGHLWFLRNKSEWRVDLYFAIILIVEFYGAGHGLLFRLDFEIWRNFLQQSHSDWASRDEQGFDLTLFLENLHLEDGFLNFNAHLVNFFIDFLVLFFSFMLVEVVI